MNILYCIRKDYLIKIAGDSIQLLRTVNYIRDMGIKVDIDNGKIDDYSKYDIIHLFNLTRISETYRFFKKAQEYRKNIVISPIYWNLEKYYRSISNDYNLLIWKRYRKFRSEILNGCKMIYPTSNIGMRLIKKEYGKTLPCTVIYNGVDIKELNKYKNKRNRDDKKTYILCVARICPRKNQFILSQICYQLGLRLLLAGEASNKEYLNKCLRYNNVEYIGFLNFEKLVKLYKNAKLHVLCSFVETPGLSSLEAGVCGCNIVSTAEGSAYEYFKDLAIYCNPYDNSNIYNAVKKGIELNNQPDLKNHILNNFTLEKCLKKLYKSYLEILNR